MGQGIHPKEQVKDQGDEIGEMAVALQVFKNSVYEVHKHSGVDKISLVGYCMGGLLTLLYAGAHGHDNIQNIVTVQVARNIDWREVIAGVTWCTCIITDGTD